MASGSNSNGTVPSKRRQFTATLTCTQTSLPTLPFDVVAEILCRLPVKLLLQLRCLGKSFNSLISDPKFAKKHLHFSPKRHHLMVDSTNRSPELLLFDSPISSVFRVTLTQISHPISQSPFEVCSLDMCSCDGILCLAINHRSPLLWNPSIRKFKILPPFENPQRSALWSFYSFGYDHFIDNFKVVVISFFSGGISNEINIHTLGMESWRKIQDCPYSSVCHGPGVFASGAVNWLIYDASSSSPSAIVSLDLEKESYRKLSHPDLKKGIRTLGVLKDCLCIFANGNMFIDVWVMKEYGNKESWTKFYNVTYMRYVGLYAFAKMLYIYEDDQMLINFHDMRNYKLKLGLYNSKNGTLKFPKIQNIVSQMDSEVYVESLISPCC